LQKILFPENTVPRGTAAVIFAPPERRQKILPPLDLRNEEPRGHLSENSAAVTQI
jgi:hypothetical protein